MHTWCGVHLLHDLKGLYEFEPGEQDWASQMASLLIEARGAASAARLAAPTVLDPAVLDDLVTHYGNSPPPGWPAAFTAGPRPRRTPAASPAGSSASKTSSSALPPSLEPAG
jgi:hypothetical protein